MRDRLRKAHAALAAAGARARTELARAEERARVALEDAEARARIAEARAAHAEEVAEALRASIEAEERRRSSLAAPRAAPPDAVGGADLLGLARRWALWRCSRGHHRHLETDELISEAWIVLRSEWHRYDPDRPGAAAPYTYACMLLDQRLGRKAARLAARSGLTVTGPVADGAIAAAEARADACDPGEIDPDALGEAIAEREARRRRPRRGRGRPSKEDER